ncbi:secreted RxLR effector protein 161-like [Solanum verrucosum]|uniref:secreted RxLR effector protein 161-like n=1 Tax=Solanum verrucosum TaxID=315347 RepID=UPI0020D146DC|nr:secreted RxLR effector protein 161-like [Solanum verrucosum]
METIPYSFIVGSLMYVQTCTKPDISFAVGMLERYQSNPGIDHWKAAKKVLRYLKGTKDYMLMYRKFNHLEVTGYSDSDFAGCVDTRKSTFGYLKEQYRGGVLSNLSLLHSQWKQNLWHVMKPQFMHYGCKTSF